MFTCSCRRYDVAVFSRRPCRRFCKDRRDRVRDLRIVEILFPDPDRMPEIHFVDGGDGGHEHHHITERLEDADTAAQDRGILEAKKKLFRSLKI